MAWDEKFDGIFLVVLWDLVDNESLLFICLWHQSFVTISTAMFQNKLDSSKVCTYEWKMLAFRNFAVQLINKEQKFKTNLYAITNMN